MTFQLDTSGYVYMPRDYQVRPGVWTKGLAFDDLDAFTQGYIEALLRDIRWPDPAEGYGPSSDVVRFSDLAPETLARIIEDCARFAELYGEWPTGEHGAGFWEGRQKDKHSPVFESLTVTLGDDGKVRLASLSSQAGVG